MKSKASFFVLAIKGLVENNPEPQQFLEAVTLLLTNFYKKIPRKNVNVTGISKVPGFLEDIKANPDNKALAQKYGVCVGTIYLQKLKYGFATKSIKLHTNPEFQKDIKNDFCVVELAKKYGVSESTLYYQRNCIRNMDLV